MVHGFQYRFFLHLIQIQILFFFDLCKAFFVPGSGGICLLFLKGKSTVDIQQHSRHTKFGIEGSGGIDADLLFHCAYQNLPVNGQG